MPKGVICGGAVDGSNQLGAIVTCHAMTARPDGARCSAAVAATEVPNSNARDNARRKRQACSDITFPSQHLRGRGRRGFVRFHARIIGRLAFGGERTYPRAIERVGSPPPGPPRVAAAECYL